MPRKSAIIQVLVVAFVLNVGIALLKLLVGYYSKTLSMVADGFHSLMDSTSNIVGFIAVTYAFEPPDEKHTYGHRKAEIVASLLIAFMLGLTCLEIIKELISRLFHPVLPVVSSTSFLVIGIGILVNVGVVWYELRAGKILNSHLLCSDAAHTRSDILVSISVLFSLIAISLQWYWLDIGVSLGITFIIGKMALQLFHENLGILLDQIPVNQKEVADVVMQQAGIQGCHQIRAHGFSDAIYLELHIEVDPQLTVTKAHELAHQVKERLRLDDPRILDVTIHIEPAAGS